MLTKFIKGSFLLSVASGVTLLSGMLVLAPLARLLGPQQLGIYSLVFWLVQSGTMIGRLGVDIAMHRNGAKLYCTDPAATGRLFAVGTTLMGLSFTTLTIAIWCWRLPLAEYWLGNQAAAEWFGYAAIILWSEGLGLVMLTGLLSLHHFQAHSLATSVAAVGRVLILPVLAWIGGLSGAFVGLLITSLLQLLIAGLNFYRGLKLYKITLNFHNFWQETKQIMDFGFPYYAGNAFISVVTVPMMGELGRIAGIETLGQVRIGQSLGQIVNLLPGAIAPVAISILSEAHGNEEKNFHRLKSVHLRGNWLISLTLVMFVSLGAHPLIFFLFSNSYQNAIPVVIGLSWANLLMVISGSLNIYSLSVGRSRLVAFASICQKFIYISMTFWLMPTLGGIGFVLGLLLGTGLQILLIFAALWSETESILKNQVLILSVCTLIIFGLVTMTNTLNLSLPVSIIVALLLSNFLAIIVTFLALSNPEKKKITLLAMSLYKKLGV
ncbi:MAG: oligosaccharide flippase family protein [Nostocales cyanobacterium W4_Combined_metabat2_030]|nr:oligosaccharide flippase family protein [Nostocales cyanobacterium W4_Combined_metabat2_030]